MRKTILTAVALAMLAGPAMADTAPRPLTPDQSQMIADWSLSTVAEKHCEALTVNALAARARFQAIGITGDDIQSAWFLTLSLSDRIQIDQSGVAKMPEFCGWAGMKYGPGGKGFLKAK